MMPFTVSSADLSQALERQEFVLHYQPEVDARSERILGVEALLRWKHPSQGTLMPAVFMPCALSSGLIQPIGAWVLRTACLQLASWRRDAVRCNWSMSVNIEVCQSEQQEFFEQLTRMLQECALDPRQLCLEVTERELTRDFDQGVATIRALADLGIRVGLDNFGIGLSGFFTLMRLPLSFIKAPARLDADLKADAGDLATVKAVTAMGHARGLKVIATMVETIGQRDAVRKLGCDGIQGFLFGHPLPPDAIP